MKTHLWLVALFLVPLLTHAQSDFFKNPPLTISFYNHSIDVPFKDIFKTPINFGVAIGTEFKYNQGTPNAWRQKLEIGWYHHKNLSTAVWLKTDVVYRYQTTDGLFGEAQIGVGYIHDFNAYQTFQLKDGQYQAISHKGKGGLLVGAGVGTGYEFELNDNYNMAPFVRYESFIQTPYSKFQSIFPHALFHVGSRFSTYEE